MNVTTGAFSFDGYKVQASLHGWPSPHSLSLRNSVIMRFCHSYFTSVSFSPATWSTGLGLSFGRLAGLRMAADGATAAKRSPRAAHRRYVNPPPFEWPVE